MKLFPMVLERLMCELFFAPFIFIFGGVRLRTHYVLQTKREQVP